MREKRYTAGPWVAHPQDQGGYGQGVYVEVTADADRKTVANILCHDDRLDEQPYAANAHLIAASPDLLEALEGFVDFYPSGINPYLDEAYNKARAALAKAYGESE